MIAVRLYSRSDFEAKLARYNCKLVAKVAAGFELWESGWGAPFTLMPETADGEDYFPEEQLRRFLIFVGKTMPPDYFNGH